MLYLGRVLSVRLLRMLAASLDELGKLCAGALEERTQLALPAALLLADVLGH